MPLQGGALPRLRTAPGPQYRSEGQRELQEQPRAGASVSGGSCCSLQQVDSAPTLGARRLGARRGCGAVPTAVGTHRRKNTRLDTPSCRSKPGLVPVRSVPQGHLRQTCVVTHLGPAMLIWATAR